MNPDEKRKCERMMKANEKQKIVTWLDGRIAVAVFFCLLTSTLLDYFNLRFAYGEMRLEVIQKMTACIACLLCCQENTKISGRAGVNRLIITGIGGAVGIGVVLLNQVFRNAWIMVVMVAAGVLLTLILCKAARVPYINARIGGVTFILVACTLASTARIYYAIFRLVSTVYGVLMVLLVTWISEKIAKRVSVGNSLNDA